MFTRAQLRNSNKLIKSLPKILSQEFHTTVTLKCNHEEYVRVDIKGEVLKFPNVWLRDNCQCEKCFHHSAKSRILDYSHFDVNIKPKDVTKNENSLDVTWPDGHTSQYKYDWLKFRSFTQDHQKNYTETIYKPNKVIWHGEDLSKICSKHQYNDILNSDEALYDWLKKLSIYGVCLVENTPDSDMALDKLVAKIGFTKQTHYGVKYVVQSVPNTSNVAYLSSTLHLHTDLPYYEYCPGVNMLHCLVQTKGQGGENMLSDSHYVANYMKEKHPKEYRLLTDVEVEWSDVGVEDGNEFFKLYRSPVIVRDKHGDISRVNYSTPQRGSHFPGLIDDVVPWYKALSLFFKLNDEFSARFKTEAGNILVFDNIRLLHGRKAYEDTTNNVRKLIGAYVDWDEIYSRLRCLKIKLDKNTGI